MQSSFYYSYPLDSFLLFQILSCGGILNNTNQRTTTKDCFALSINGNGDSEWTRYNSFTEDLSSSGWSIGPKSVFLQKYGTYIFGSGKSQFLPIGSNEWQRGNFDKNLCHASFTHKFFTYHDPKSQVLQKMKQAYLTLMVSALLQ